MSEDIGDGALAFSGLKCPSCLQLCAGDVEMRGKIEENHATTTENPSGRIVNKP